MEELWNDILFIFDIPVGALQTDTFVWTNSIGGYFDGSQEVTNGVVAIEDVTLGPISTESIEYDVGLPNPPTEGGTDTGNITFAPEPCGPGLGCIVQGLGTQPIATFTYTPVPEPSSVVLLGTLVACALGLVVRNQAS